MHRNLSNLARVLTLTSIASLSLLTGAGATAPDAQSTTASVRASGLYVRPSNGSAMIAGRRVNVRAFLYNNYMPPVNARMAGLGNLIISIDPNDARGLPSGITAVTAEINQGRLRWKGTLTPQYSPLADLAAQPNALFSEINYGASGIRTFPAGSKVTVTLTIRANKRDTRVTLRNVEVGAAY